MKPVIIILLAFSLAACNNRSMRGIDDGLTVIGVILAIMIGAYYFIKKVFMSTKRRDDES